MASTDARPIPIRATAYRVTFPIWDADGDLVTGATGLDSEVSKDGGTFADCTNEATEIATSSGMYYLDLTSTEMTADTVAVIVKTSTVGAKTTPLVFYPNEAGDIDVDVTAWNGTAVTTPNTAGTPVVDVTRISGTTVSTTSAQLGVNVVQISTDATAADNAEAFFDGTGYAGTGNVIPTVTTTTTATNVTTVNGLAANTVTASALATDAVSEIADGILNRDMSTGTDSGSASVRTMRQALRFLRNKWTISGTTLTVYKEDDSTSSWTGTVTTSASAEPVTANDPAS